MKSCFLNKNGLTERKKQVKLKINDWNVNNFKYEIRGEKK